MSAEKSRKVRARKRDWGVFVDRDGTIIDETGYLSDPDRARLLPNAAQALRMLNDLGVPVIVISNQSGIARGMYAARDVEKVNSRIRDLLQAEGAFLDQMYYCPHHPDYDVECDCRKPQPGLLIKGAREFGILLDKSFMIGDKLIDIQAGKAAGTQAIFLRTGDGEKELERAREEIVVTADRICEDLLEAVQWILGCMNITV